MKMRQRKHRRPTRDRWYWAYSDDEFNFAMDTLIDVFKAVAERSEAFGQALRAVGQILPIEAAFTLGGPSIFREIASGTRTITGRDPSEPEIQNLTPPKSVPVRTLIHDEVIDTDYAELEARVAGSHNPTPNAP